MNASTSNDRPLSGMANVTLQIGAGATILFFYLFVLFSILILLVILLVELVIFLALARFGLGRLFVPVIARHGGFLGIFLRSLWLEKPREFQVPLRPEDAPGLFTMLAAVCKKAGVPLPRRVQLQMGVTAWVRMKGYRKGAGTSILGMGYDLLAGLTQMEIEGVLAHEMMHAKLVQRGFRQLLGKGLGRAAKLSNALRFQVRADRRARKSTVFLENFMHGADALTRLAARQISACSRQDEFAADWGAAELTGATALRSSLLKLDGLGQVATRIPLRDRIAQLESGESFGEWLVREMASVSPQAQAEIQNELFNPYSTHPSLHDRLAALASFPDEPSQDSPPALGLLAHPDKVAEDLVVVIQKELAAQEQKDSKMLNRLGRKTRTGRHIGPLKAVGILLAMAAVVGLIIALASGMSVFAILLWAGALALGITLFVLEKYQEKIALPVPDYSLIKSVAQKKLDVPKELVETIEKELRNVGGKTKKGAQRAAFYVKHSYAALANCDYIRAHIAARFCLEQEKNSIPGHLAFAVAAGGLKQTQQTVQAIRFIQQRIGMRGNSTAWGAGWALALIGDWAYAEVFLEQARIKMPSEATVLSLLAVAQLRRNKLFSAVTSARRAHILQPENITHSKLLIDLLLQGGFLREAHEYLHRLVHEAMADSELTYAMATLCLSQRNIPIAEQWIEVITQNSDGPQKFVQIGRICETARQDQRAVDFFQHALTHGHYPEALFGLGRVEAHRQNKDQARAYFMTALNLEQPAAESSSGAVSLVVPLLQQMRLLETPILPCRAWIAKLPAQVKVPALVNTSFLVYASSREEAEQTFAFTLKAMQPNSPMPAAAWSVAPKEQQPDGPTLPGVLHLAA